LDVENGCISGSIRNIENIELDFDFEANSDYLRYTGQVKIQLTNVTFEYKVKPLAYNTSESFHDQGKFGFNFEYFNATADESKHMIYGKALKQVEE